jgi:hypothetical protein
MKRTLLFILLLSVSSCAKNAPPNLSPVGQSAYTNTQRIQALDILRDTAIDLNAKGSISVNTTRRIVMAHESILKLINASAAGWQVQASFIANGILIELPKKETDLLTPFVNSVLVSLQ